MNITITLSEEDQSLQAEILKVLLTPKSDKSDTPKSDKSDKSDKTPKSTQQPTKKPSEQPTPKPYPLPTNPAPSDTSDSSDKTALSMADLRKSVNAISRKKGLNWLYSWLGDLGVKSITEIPTDRLEEAHSKLQNYA